MPASDPGLPPGRQSRRRWLRVGLRLGAVATTCAALLLGYMIFSTLRAWEAAEAEADEWDPRWRLAEIEADRVAIADADNSARHMIEITDNGKIAAVSAAPKYDKIFEPMTPAAQLNSQQIRLLRTELAKIAKPLDGARRLKDMPRGHFPINDADIFLNSADWQVARRCAEWLQHDAWLMAEEQKTVEAVESCRAIINAGRALAHEPGEIALLIRTAFGIAVAPTTS